MTIRLQTTGIHHATVRSADLSRSRAFYGGALGLPIVLETWDSFVALAGNTVLVIRGPDLRTTAGTRGLPPGVECVGLACADAAQLERAAVALAAAHVPSTGLRFNPVLQQRYIAFTDPDGTAWELHLTAHRPADIDWH
jgi:catechol 2,3-dioxygenase-like lactoylglutathione lyase family enzyme